MRVRLTSKSIVIHQTVERYIVYFEKGYNTTKVIGSVHEAFFVVLFDHQK